MRFKERPQLPGAGRARAGHHHGSHKPTSSMAILLVKWPITPNKSAGSVVQTSKQSTHCIKILRGNRSNPGVCLVIYR